jgi:hypothetical protein
MGKEMKQNCRIIFVRRAKAAMSKEEIKAIIERLQGDIQRLESLTGKQRKKGTAFVIREKQDAIEQYKLLLEGKGNEQQ